MIYITRGTRKLHRLNLSLARLLRDRSVDIFSRFAFGQTFLDQRRCTFISCSWENTRYTDNLEDDRVWLHHVVITASNEYEAKWCRCSSRSQAACLTCLNVSRLKAREARKDSISIHIYKYMSNINIISLFHYVISLDVVINSNNYVLR